MPACGLAGEAFCERQEGGGKSLILITTKRVISYWCSDVLRGDDKKRTKNALGGDERASKHGSEHARAKILGDDATDGVYLTIDYDMV